MRRGMLYNVFATQAAWKVIFVTHFIPAFWNKESPQKTDTMGKNGQFDTANILHQVYFLISKLTTHFFASKWTELFFQTKNMLCLWALARHRGFQCKTLSDINTFLFCTKLSTFTHGVKLSVVSNCFKSLIWDLFWRTDITNLASERHPNWVIAATPPMFRFKFCGV